MSRTVQHGLAELTRYLASAQVDNPTREARLLLAHVLGTEPGRMTLLAPDPLGAGEMERALAMAAQRASGAPMSHIVGHRAFWGRRFRVSARVLDPRPETECLVALALDQPFARLLDLGTGSGCIAITLLAERPEAVGTATDLSGPALGLAGENAAELGVADRLGCVRSDWFDAVGGRYDLIVSNPPYIAAAEMPGLARELSFEPRMALTDEADGLNAYRSIAAGLPDHLTSGGRVLLEIGPTQAAAVCALLARAGLGAIAVHPDLDGRDRVVSARMPAQEPG